MPHHVFISHAHADADAAMSILAALEGRGIKCWVAPRDVPPGGSYAEAILTAIENASCFVLVYSQNSNASRHVLREVERALSLGINIIPVRFDSSSVSKSLDYLLATVHWLSVIAEPREIGIGHAAERIASTVSDADKSALAPNILPPPLFAPAAPPAGRRQSSLPPLLIWLTLAVLAAAGIVLAVTNLRRATPNEALASPTPAASPALLASAETPTATAPPAAGVSSAPAVEAAPVANPEETVQEMPAPTAAPSRTIVSREPPLGIVRRYFGYLSDRNTIKAYELLSTGYRSRETFVTYTRNFASTTSLRFLSAHEISLRGGVASVYVAFEKNNQKFGRIEWRGPIELTSEPAGWRINSLRGLRPSSTRR